MGLLGPLGRGGLAQPCGPFVSIKSLERAACWYRCWYRSTWTVRAITASIFVLELVAVRLHDRTGDDRVLVALPVGWTLERGDLLASEDDRLVRVVELRERPRPSAH